MGKVQENLERYGPYLWVCIPGNAGKTPHYVELVSKCLGYAGQIHGALSKGLSAGQTLHAMKNDRNFRKDLFVETMAVIVGQAKRHRLLPEDSPRFAMRISNN